MAILQLVDQLADMLDQGRDVPFSRYRMVDAEVFAQILERMRISVPSSIRESERTLAERDNILAQARAQADQLISDAETRVRELANQDAIVVMARQEASSIVAEGELMAEQRMKEADQYVTQVLLELSEKLKAIMHQVDNGITLMAGAANEIGSDADTNAIQMRNVEIGGNGNRTSDLK